MVIQIPHFSIFKAGIYYWEYLGDNYMIKAGWMPISYIMFSENARTNYKKFNRAEANLLNHSNRILRYALWIQWDESSLIRFYKKLETWTEIKYHVTLWREKEIQKAILYSLLLFYVS